MEHLTQLFASPPPLHASVTPLPGPHLFYGQFLYLDRDALKAHARAEKIRVKDRPFTIARPARAFLSSRVIAAPDAATLLTLAQTTNRLARCTRGEDIVDEQPVVGLRIMHGPAADGDALGHVLAGRVKLPTIWFADAFVPTHALQNDSRYNKRYPSTAQEKTVRAMGFGYDRHGLINRFQRSFADDFKADLPYVAHHLDTLYPHGCECDAIGKGFALLAAGPDGGRPYCAVPVGGTDAVISRPSLREAHQAADGLFFDRVNADVHVFFDREFPLSEQTGSAKPISRLLTLPFTEATEVVRWINKRPRRQQTPLVALAQLDDADLLLLNDQRPDMATLTYTHAAAGSPLPSSKHSEICVLAADRNPGNVLSPPKLTSVPALPAPKPEPLIAAQRPKPRRNPAVHPDQTALL